MNRNMHFIPWKNICLTDGFWKHRQQVAAKETSRAIYDRFANTGRIEAMKLSWQEGMPNKPHVFWDSDVAKWMEGAACFLALEENPVLRARLDGLIDDILSGQTADGYFNSAYLTLRPDRRFTDRTEHELYTAGHLIEAAVTHYEATGETRFLKAMERFADLIARVFVTEDGAPYATPGHQELELALVRLYRATGEKRHLALARHFVDTRGTQHRDRVFSVPNGTWPAMPPLANQLLYNDTYAQDEAPARELQQTGGHAVRAMYFYSAMADLALEDGDEALKTACERLWSDSVNHKMYITGGVSAERFGEAIGTNYVLPNDLAYAETCASVAMANFSQRMLCLSPDGKYADMIERQMFNGALAGLSMDGRAFYYDNALQCRVRVSDFFADIHALPLYPPYQRQELFECSCCPPNIYRFLAEMGQYFYSVKTRDVYVHQYATGTANLCVEDAPLCIEQETAYPWDGEIGLTIHAAAPVDCDLHIRIPGWCRSWSLSRNDESLSQTPIQGYVRLCGSWREGDRVLLKLDMPVEQMAAHPAVVENAGRVALQRGPVVYCLEGIDQPATDLFRVLLPRGQFAWEIGELEIKEEKVPALRANVLSESLEGWQDMLYRPVHPTLEETQITAIPYFAWANRGANDMTVWIRKQA